MANSAVSNLFIAEVSDQDDKYVYAVRARTAPAAERKIKKYLKEEGTNLEEVMILVNRYTLQNDVTCIG